MSTTKKSSLPLRTQAEAMVYKYHRKPMTSMREAFEKALRKTPAVKKAVKP
jgi:hypothetical protein